VTLFLEFFGELGPAIDLPPPSSSTQFIPTLCAIGCIRRLSELDFCAIVSRTPFIMKRLGKLPKDSDGDKHSSLSEAKQKLGSYRTSTKRRCTTFEECSNGLGSLRCLKLLPRKEVASDVTWSNIIIFFVFHREQGCRVSMFWALREDSDGGGDGEYALDTTPK
jgi:hypothetical protein